MKKKINKWKFILYICILLKNFILFYYCYFYLFLFFLILSLLLDEKTLNTDFHLSTLTLCSKLEKKENVVLLENFWFGFFTNKKCISETKHFLSRIYFSSCSWLQIIVVWMKNSIFHAPYSYINKKNFPNTR